jgi:hypothetical protein
MKRALAILSLLLAFGASTVRAQDASLTVTPDRTSLLVNERLQVRVQLEGPGVSNQGPFNLPSLEPQLKLVRANGPQVQQSYQIINGRMQNSGSIAMEYVFEAKAAGSVTVPALQYRAGNVLVTSAPVTIVIGDAPNPNMYPGDTAWHPPTDPYVEMKVSQREAYVGEQIVVSWYLYNRKDLTDLQLFKMPTAGDFTIADLGQVSQLNPIGKMFSDGRWSVSYLKGIAIYPNKAGDLELDGMGLNYSKPTHERDFFGNLVMGRDTVESPSAKIKVKPLPEAGKPDDFSGAVGTFTLGLDKTAGKLAADEQFKFTLTVSGDGHPDFVPKPALDLPSGFDLYTEGADKNVRNEQGRAAGVRTFKMIIVPHAAGEYQLGPFHFSYFDPQSKTYRRAESARLSLAVTPGANAGPSGPGSVAPVAVTEVGKDLRFIKLDPQPAGDRGQWLLASPALIALQFVPLLGVLAAAGFRHRRDRLSANPAYARRLRAGKAARRGLNQARKALAAGALPAVHAQVQLALTGYVADRCDLAEAGITTADAAAALRNAAMPAALAGSVEQVLSRCDMARYAPGVVNEQDAGKVIEQAGAAIAALEKEVGT